MKREIYCMGCAERTKRKYADPENPYPGEHMKYLEGLAIAFFNCDLCFNGIHRGHPCFAVSTWVDGRSVYDEWESRFIFPIKRGKMKKTIGKNYLKAICKIGQMEKTCRYIYVDGNGIQCGKTDPAMKKTFDERVDQMNAKGDNCDGFNVGLKCVNK